MPSLTKRSLCLIASASLFPRILFAICSTPTQLERFKGYCPLESTNSCTRERRPCRINPFRMKTSRSSQPPQKVVNFCKQPHVQYFESSPPRNSRPRKSRLRMEEQIYKKYEAGQVTETMLQEAAVLFSENYGVWGERATGKFVKLGKLPRNHLRSSAN